MWGLLVLLLSRKTRIPFDSFSLSTLLCIVYKRKTEKLPYRTRPTGFSLLKLTRGGHSSFKKQGGARAALASRPPKRYFCHSLSIQTSLLPSFLIYPACFRHGGKNNSTLEGQGRRAGVLLTLLGVPRRPRRCCGLGASPSGCRCGGPGSVQVLAGLDFDPRWRLKQKERGGVREESTFKLGVKEAGNMLSHSRKSVN